MRKALFLDRDGVINEEINYLYKIEDFVLVKGIINLCKDFLRNGYIIVVVTNQAGIARKKYSEKDFMILTHWMLELFEKHEIKISKVYHCPHHPDFTGECSCRKPNIGMVLQAKKDYDLDLKSSLLIGDKESDIEAGINAGISKTILLSNTIKISKADIIVQNLKEIQRK